ncbi:structural maintenance of chromosomes flexible hinge domain-containing protein GMI1-like [Solanum pennellii]|uniref:Structural maintenance of chromosomes flexible hinge domain-containing protein GMI1-like n=1 Tax=Solanum pennellii TaxID=28526 RepID=A0ABM1V5K5_SOLPN|nr:structural maintenance of chromosomes flexible hinge domain-containing protein GMI1-like [Solanum pennellii]
MLKKLEADGFGITENFETFSHVSVRRLGRLLPDARWALPQDVDAGHEPPEEITAVVRPASFTSATASKNLDQKYIMKENFAMTPEIKFKDDENVKEQHIYSGQLNPSSLKGFHGLYISISIFSCKLYDLQISILIYTE